MIELLLIAALVSPVEVLEPLSVTGRDIAPDARIAHDGLKRFLGDAYAGAWFDDEVLKLMVAITDAKMESWVKVAGARPVLVKRSLSELKAIKELVFDETQRNAQWREGVTSWYVDYSTNNVVIEALPEYIEYIEEQLPLVSASRDAIRVDVSAGRPVLEYQARGGDEFRDIHDNPRCSIGFTVSGGFVTAGHCGSLNEQFRGSNSALLGVMAGTDWSQYDRGWVSTNSNWTMLPEVNGYSDGVIGVSGSTNAIKGTWVCRYGRTTGGPHCVEVHSTSNEVCYDSPCTKMQTRVNGLCSAQGDSGGPYLDATGKGVGTHSGGSGGCSSNAVKYFHPLDNSLSHFNLTLLTTNGGNPPQITSWVCPDHDNSGSGQYYCYVSYNSQGSTQVSWTGPGTAAGDTFFGTCAKNTQVTVSATVTNGHGSDSRSSSFGCPDNEIQ